MRHKHADIIRAWVEGEKIEYKCPETGLWLEAITPVWHSKNVECRIKPKEPEWWENIPHHGILVRSKHTGAVYVFGLRDIEVKDDFYPLTNQEIERFKR